MGENPRIMALLVGYQIYFEKEEIVITVTVIDGSILREATKRGQMANNHIHYVPLYHIRGIFSPNASSFYTRGYLDGEKTLLTQKLEKMFIKKRNYTWGNEIIDECF